MRALVSAVIGAATLTLLTACAEPGPETMIANPASRNCIKQGGVLTMKKRPDGGVYGVCLFEDNRQCEEWALFRGVCPKGGRKITGYATLAARYCAITGGAYAVTAQQSGTTPEQGTCSAPSGKTCDVHKFFEGGC